MKERDILFSPDKLGYVKGVNRPKVECILCSALLGEEGVDNLIVFCSRKFFVTLNLYPYNPGHLMICPRWHTETMEEFSDEEVVEHYTLQKLSLNVLKRMYRPMGFNLGYNMGQSSGASIAHLHYHIIPRYRSELGFMDVINGTRIIVESPVVTRDRMIDAFSEELKEWKDFPYESSQE